MVRKVKCGLVKEVVVGSKRETIGKESVLRRQWSGRQVRHTSRTVKDNCGLVKEVVVGSKRKRLVRDVVL